MDSKILGTSENGLIEYCMLTKQHLDGAMEIMRKAFFMYETVSVAIELPLHPEAIAELDDLVLRTIKDGVSIVAVEKSSGKVVGAALNKINVNTIEDDNYLPNYRDSCKTPSAKALLQFMIDIDHECDLFELLNVDCVVEIMFLATLQDYLGRGIAKTLHALSIDVVRELHNGKNVKQSITGEPLPLEPRPMAVSAYYTSFITQKIGEKLGFKRAASASFDKWNYNGKLFSETIGPESPCATVDYFLF